MVRQLGNQYISTLGEEIANSVSHGVMTVLALAAVPFVAVWGFTQYGMVEAVSLSIYATCLFLMFAVSTLYHSLNEGKAKDIFHLLDHIFIYVLIAGSYTPASLSIIGGWKGITLVSIQWAIVLFGILYKTLVKNQSQKVSLAIYLAMGWSIVFFGKDVYTNATMPFIIWIALGGVLYTIGAIIYGKKGFKFHHLVWHIFINLAAACQFIGFVFCLK